MPTASLTGSSEETEQQQQSAVSVEAAPSSSAAKPSIQQTMADLDALLGIEEKKEEVAPQVGGWVAAGGKAAASAACLLPAAFLLLCAVAGGSGKQPVARGPHRNVTLHVPASLLQPAKPSADNVSITISPDVLRALADAEAARAEKLGSSASSGEMQTRMRDSIERIVEQVGAGWVRCVHCSGGAPWVLAVRPLERRRASAPALLLQPPPMHSLHQPGRASLLILLHAPHRLMPTAPLLAAIPLCRRPRSLRKRRGRAARPPGIRPHWGSRRFARS